MIGNDTIERKGEDARQMLKEAGLARFAVRRTIDPKTGVVTIRVRSGDAHLCRCLARLAQAEHGWEVRVLASDKPARPHRHLAGAAEVG